MPVLLTLWSPASQSGRGEWRWSILRALRAAEIIATRSHRMPFHFLTRRSRKEVETETWMKWRNLTMEERSTWSPCEKWKPLVLLKFFLFLFLLWNQRSDRSVRINEDILRHTHSDRTHTANTMTMLGKGWHTACVSVPWICVPGTPTVCVCAHVCVCVSACVSVYASACVCAYVCPSPILTCQWVSVLSRICHKGLGSEGTHQDESPWLNSKAHRPVSSQWNQ